MVQPQNIHGEFLRYQYEIENLLTTISEQDHNKFKSRTISTGRVGVIHIKCHISWCKSLSITKP